MLMEENKQDIELRYKEIGVTEIETYDWFETTSFVKIFVSNPGK